MTIHDEHTPKAYRSPASIRNEAFAKRMRGLDADEVYEYLDLLADQIEVCERERREARTANEQLQADNQRLQSALDAARAEISEFESVGDRVNEQVVQLFSQAQLVAEEMVQDVSKDARERLGRARAQERQIVDEAVSVAGEHVRTYAQTAQSQMQAIMNTFANQVDRLGDSPQEEDGFPAYDPDGWRIEAARANRRDAGGA